MISRKDAKTQRRAGQNNFIGVLSEYGVRQIGSDKGVGVLITENLIAKEIVDAAYHVHVTLGPGLLESVYETILLYEIEKRHLHAGRQVSIPIVYNGLRIEDAFKADIIVENKVIVELKSVESVLPVHSKQLLTYLRLTEMKLGLLINFGAPVIKDGIKRIVNGLLA